MEQGGDAFEAEIRGLSELAFNGQDDILQTYDGTYADGDSTRPVELRAIPTDYVDDQTTEQFVYNAQNWRKAATHPNIVELLDWGTEPRPWILVDNTHVGDFETVRHGLDVATACALVDDVAEALRNAGLYNVAHLDLRPSVIKLTDDQPPSAQVGDWGVTRAVATRHGEYVTPYTAPEQLDASRTASAAVTDVYGLGGLAYFALTGHPPYLADREAILTGNLTVPSTRNPDLPDEADAVVTRALSHDPGERPQSALRFAEQFRKVTDQLGTPSTTGGAAGGAASGAAAGSAAGGGATGRRESPAQRDGTEQTAAQTTSTDTATAGANEQAAAGGEHQQRQPGAGSTGGWSRRAMLAAFGTGVAGTAAGAYMLTRSNSDAGTADADPTDSQDNPDNTGENRSTPDDGATTSGGPSGPVQIGMIQPLSGALQAYGTIAMRGFYTYFGYRGANIPSEITEGTESFDVDGTTYEIDVRDSGGDQTEAQNTAVEMAEYVTALAGGTSSASALAIAANVATRQGIPYMAGPAASVQLTNSSENCSRAVFRASETVAMDAAAGAKYLANERDDVDSAYIYYADYSFGASVRDNYRRVLERNGVTVAGEQALPPGYDGDWHGQFEQAVAANVDTIIAGFTVATLPTMLSAYLANDYDFEFTTGLGTRLASAVHGSVLQREFGEVTAETIARSGFGPLTTRYHWNQYDNPINRDATEIHRSVYGTNADLFASGMFTGASALVQAVEQSGSADSIDVVDELTGMAVEETLKGQGAYKFQEYNNQARSPMTVVDLRPTENREYWDAPVQPTTPLQRYQMDETTRGRAITECRLD